MQSFLPDPTNPNSLTANYTSGLAGGFDNTPLDYCVDYDINSRHRISTIGAIGNVVDLNNFGQPFLPVPYAGGTYADIHPKIFDVEDAYTISNSMVNQLKYGFVRFAQPNTIRRTESQNTFRPHLASRIFLLRVRLGRSLLGRSLGQRQSLGPRCNSGRRIAPQRPHRSRFRITLPFWITSSG